MGHEGAVVPEDGEEVLAVEGGEELEVVVVLGDGLGVLLNLGWRDGLQSAEHEQVKNTPKNKS